LNFEVDVEVVEAGSEAVLGGMATKGKYIAIQICLRGV
jgi:hypothetical protein